MLRIEETRWQRRKTHTTRWNLDFLYPIGFPSGPRACPVQNWRKFSAVLGTVLLYSRIFIRPRGSPPSVMSKNTIGWPSSPRPGTVVLDVAIAGWI